MQVEQDTFWPGLKSSIRGTVETYSTILWIFLGLAVVFYIFIKPRIEKYLHNAAISKSPDIDPEKVNEFNEQRRLAIAKLQEKYQAKAQELGLKKVEPKPETEEQEDEDEEEVCTLSSKPTSAAPITTNPTATSSQNLKKSLRPAYNPLDGIGGSTRFKSSCSSRKKG